MPIESADRLLALLFGAPAMREVFCDRAHIQGMLDFEAALARAQARAGVIPAPTAEAIAAACDAAAFDVEALAGGAAQAGNTAIPLVRALRERVAQSDADAAQLVHLGATSQDAMDTGLVLQMREALPLLEAELARLADAAADLAERHKATLAVGRTWLQHALPVTFGLKAAGWLDAAERHAERLAELRGRVLVLQFGGAAGTLASLGDAALPVAEALAAELGLALPALPWHTHRDRVAEAGTTLALLIGTLGKIARDVSLLMQTDVGEAFEPGGPGRGGSSSMPHKRNPVSSAAVLAAAVRAPGLAATLLSAMVQEQERGLGNWPAEWRTLPELFELAAGALTQTADVVAGLEVDADRLRANLEATGGQILAEAVKMALAERLGAATAHTLVEEACRVAGSGRRHLREVLAAEPRVTAVLGPAELERLFDPGTYVGQSEAFVERALAARRRRK